MALTESPQAVPVTAEFFAARLAALGVDQDFTIAVSGGRDSMALARLATLYAKALGIGVTAFTVDHGLRPESADEAAQVSKWCKTIGLQHRILVWNGEKPKTGIQEAARNARYKLLARAANEHGFDTILTAHSADDQAETVFMRLARGAGPTGLAAMRPVGRVADGAGEPVRLVRPLLSVSRAQLTATVAGFDQAFVDDPSNDDPGYERIRTRALLAALQEQELLTQTELLRTADRMQVATQSLRAQETDLLQQLKGCFFQWGGVAIDLPNPIEIACAGIHRLCRRLVHAVSGHDYAPDIEATAKAYHQAIATGAATLGGALIKSHQHQLWFLREPAALLGRAGVQPLSPHVVAPGGAAIWDNRFIISVPAGLEAIEIEPLGVRKAPTDSFCRQSGAPADARRTIPGVYRKGALIGAPYVLSSNGGGVRITSLSRERFDGEIIRFS